MTTEVQEESNLRFDPEKRKTIKHLFIIMLKNNYRNESNTNYSFYKFESTLIEQFKERAIEEEGLNYLIKHRVISKIYNNIDSLEFINKRKAEIEQNVDQEYYKKNHVSEFFDILIEGLQEYPSYLPQKSNMIDTSDKSANTLDRPSHDNPIPDCTPRVVQVQTQESDCEKGQNPKEKQKPKPILPLKPKRTKQNVEDELADINSKINISQLNISSFENAITDFTSKLEEVTKGLETAKLEKSCTKVKVQSKKLDSDAEALTKEIEKLEADLEKLEKDWTAYDTEFKEANAKADSIKAKI